jgi:hypothetical protein
MSDLSGRLVMMSREPHRQTLAAGGIRERVLPHAALISNHTLFGRFKGLAYSPASRARTAHRQTYSDQNVGQAALDTSCGSTRGASE